MVFNSSDSKIQSKQLNQWVKRKINALPRMIPLLMNVLQFDYDELDAELSAINAGINAAECHGFLCAYLCVNKVLSRQAMQDYLLAGIDDPADLENGLIVLLRFVKQILKDMVNDDLSFTLLMPAADTALTRRSVALTEWCAGFISGLGVGGFSDSKPISDDCKELLKDIIAISRMETNAEDSEGTENDLFEIVEYIRVGVIMLFQEYPYLNDAEQPEVLR